MVLININEIFTTNDDERLIQLYNHLDKNKNYFNKIYFRKLT